ncbi:unnamed protein product [Rotaria sp. Silwood2]|nr:unnamed protein product [Rotaria sp. Silwood2]
MRRLQYEVADKVNTLSDTIQRGQHSNEVLNTGFLIKVIDNFDMNKETLHGENSLHMLNQIIVQTIENDEAYITANEVINDIIDCISTSTPPSLVVEAIKPPKQLFEYKSCFDLSLKFSLLGYCLVKCFDLFDTNGNLVLSKPIHFPILSGFFATYLNNRSRPIHTVKYCCPIKENPNDVTTIEASLRETKTNILELNHQQTAVVVVDEKLFHICTKVIGNNPNEFDGVFIYPGDFHLMKTTMIVIWQVLDGSELSDADTYISGKQTNGKKSRLLNIQSKDLSKVLHSVDRLMRDSFIIGEQRDIPLSSIFCHEFTPAPLSLCQINNYNIMNQQKKHIAIDYIRSIFPSSFSSSMPNISGIKALVIDGGTMLETKPVGRSITVRQYANQLLKTVRMN